MSQLKCDGCSKMKGVLRFAGCDKLLCTDAPRPCFPKHTGCKRDVCKVSLSRPASRLIRKVNAQLAGAGADQQKKQQ